MNEVKEILDRKINYSLSSDQRENLRSSVSQVSYAKKMPQNLLLFFYDSLGENLLHYFSLKLLGIPFELDKVRLNRPDHMDYIHMIGQEYPDSFTPAATMIEISQSMLEPPALSVDKCKIIRSLLKDIICLTKYDQAPCNKEVKILPLPLT